MKQGLKQGVTIHEVPTHVSTIETIAIHRTFIGLPLLPACLVPVVRSVDAP